MIKNFLTNLFFGKQKQSLLNTIEVWQKTSQYWYDSFIKCSEKPQSRPFVRFVTEDGLEFFEPIETYNSLCIGKEVIITRNYLTGEPVAYEINSIGWYIDNTLTYYVTKVSQ